MKTITCFGTFDILHPGHLNYFEQAKRHGDYLIVVIARDKTKKDQNKETLHLEQERLQQVQNLPIVDEAILGNIDDHFKIIRDKKPDVICLGYDQQISEEKILQQLNEAGFKTQVLRLNSFHPQKYKSSLFRQKSRSTPA